MMERSSDELGSGTGVATLGPCDAQEDIGLPDLVSSEWIEAIDGAPPDLVAALDKGGWLVPRLLATWQGEGGSEVAVFLGGLFPGGVDSDARMAFDSLVDLAVQEAAEWRKRFAQMDLEEMRAAQAKRVRRVVVATDVARVLQPQTPAPPAVVRWPTRVRRRLADAEGPKEVARIQEDDRRKQLGVLIGVIQEARLPLAREATEALNPEAAMRTCGRGRRGSTMRQRTREWMRCRAWLMRVFAVVWPAVLQQVLDCVAARAEEPCKRSFFRAFQCSLAFIEAAPPQCVFQPSRGSPTRSRRTSERRRFGLEESSAERQSSWRSGSSWHSKPTSWTRTSRSYARVFAGYRLARIWGSLRLGDARWIKPSGIRLDGRGLRLELSQTKTAGPGKKVQILIAWVAKSAYLTSEKWMSIWFRAWQTFGLDGDYALPRPNLDLSGCVDKPADYPSISASSKVLLQGVAAPKGDVWQGEGVDLEDDEALNWAPGDHPLVAFRRVVFFYTEHADRAWLVSAGAAIGLSGEDLDRLGRWSPSGSDEYVRASRAICERVQAEVATRIRRDFAGPDILDEEEVLGQLKEYLTDAGEERQEVDDQLDALQYFDARLPIPQVSGLPAVEAGPPRLPIMNVVEHYIGDEAPGEGVATPPPTALDSAQAKEEDEEFLGVVEDGDEGLPSADELGSAGAGEGPTAIENAFEQILLPEAAPEAEVSRPAGFVVCYTMGRSRKKLRHVRGCWRAPCVDYVEYSDLGEDPPSPSRCNSVCGQRWSRRSVAPSYSPVAPEAAAAEGAEAEEVQEGEESSSSSDSAEACSLCGDLGERKVWCVWNTLRCTGFYWRLKVNFAPGY